MSEIPIDEFLCKQIKRTEQALMAHHDSVLRKHGLSVAQYTVLLSLSREEHMSGAQLARASGVTQQTMGSVLTGLVTRDLISRQVSSLHAKVQIITLTEAGRRAFEDAYGEVAVLEAELGKAFSDRERATLLRLLARATSVLTQQTVAG